MTIYIYYLRARYYDPGVMRFITEDTNKGDVKDPLSLNLYTYCQGNPIRYFDPTGHAPGDLFRSMEDAAYDFGLTYNEKSIEAHQEYGSSIYFVKIEVIMDHSIETGVDFKNTVVYYSYTKPNIGNGGNSVLPSITLKGAIVATVHSHGNYVVQYKGGNDVMSFSKPGGDSWWSDIFNIPAYMVNPKGELLRYIPDSEDKRGKVIRKWLPHDPFHPDWRSRKWFYQQVE